MPPINVTLHILLDLPRDHVLFQTQLFVGRSHLRCEIPVDEADQSLMRVWKKVTRRKKNTLSLIIYQSFRVKPRFGSSLSQHNSTSVFRPAQFISNSFSSHFSHTFSISFCSLLSLQTLNWLCHYQSWMSGALTFNNHLESSVSLSSTVHHSFACLHASADIWKNLKSVLSMPFTSRNICTTLVQL